MFGTAKLQAKVEGAATVFLGVILLSTLWIDADTLKEIAKYLQKMPKAGKIFITILGVFLILIGLKD